MEALDLLDRTLAEGESEREYEQVALIALSRFTLLTSHRSLAESQQGLEVAKKAVLRCGDGQLFAALHARVGQAYAQRSLPSVAIGELEFALSLMAAEPNAGIEGFINLALSGAEYLLARSKAAAKRARGARLIADRNGLHGLKAAAQANLAFLECRRGNFESAKALAAASLDSVPSLSLARGALLDTLANVALVEGHLERAHDCVAQINVINSALSSSSLLLVDSAPARAQLLRLQGDWEQALDVLTQARQAADSRGDAANWAKLTLLRAEALCAVNDRVACDRDLLDVLQRAQSPNAEVLGLLARARAVRAAAAGDGKRARSEFARASRVFGASGDKFMVLATASVQADCSRSSGGHQTTTPLRRPSRRLDLAESLSFVCALLPQPHLAGAEAVRLVRRLRIVETVELKTCDAANPAGPDDVVLGSVGSEELALRVRASNDPQAAEAIAHIQSVLRVAVAGSRARLESARRVLSWELDVAPEGAVGLYVASNMKRLLATIRKVAMSNAPVLIAGETGTGKEIVAKEIHASSKHAQRPFVAFNVTAVPREMLEGQLFGYRRGAFTGAVTDAKGLIREAEGGTLFIDEIGELSPDLQPKLLRFLESGEIQPLGERPQRVEVRIVAATNAHLDRLVREGRFREDLFYRLNVVSLTIPPLRERREEIPTLLHHFLTQHAKEAGKLIPQLSAQVLERLSAYDWPGNVRQLTNELKRIVALCDENEIVGMEQLSESIRQPTPAPAAPPSTSADPTVTVRLDQTLQEMYDDVERAAIPRALRLSRQNQTETARRLGITRKGLFLKRKRLGIPVGDSEQP